MNTKSEEDYLKCLYHLQEGKSAVSTNEIAKYLSMKASSVSDMLKKLADKNLVNYLRYKGSTLTKKGELIALNIIRKHRLWETFWWKNWALVGVRFILLQSSWNMLIQKNSLKSLIFFLVIQTLTLMVIQFPKKMAP